MNKLYLSCYAIMMFHALLSSPTFSQKELSAFFGNGKFSQEVMHLATETIDCFLHGMPLEETIKQLDDRQQHVYDRQALIRHIYATLDRYKYALQFPAYGTEQQSHNYALQNFLLKMQTGYIVIKIVILTMLLVIASYYLHAAYQWLNVNFTPHCRFGQGDTYCSAENNGPIDHEHQPTSTEPAIAEDPKVLPCTFNHAPLFQALEDQKSTESESVPISKQSFLLLAPQIITTTSCAKKITRAHLDRSLQEQVEQQSNMLSAIAPSPNSAAVYSLEKRFELNSLPIDKYKLTERIEEQLNVLKNLGLNPTNDPIEGAYLC